MYKVAIILWLHEFFLAASPMFAIFSAFMMESGLNPMMIGICFSIFFMTVTLCELPSSLVADKYSRKKVLIVSDIFCITGSIIMLLSHSQFAFIACLVLTAVGSALKSGTIEALLYDEMKYMGCEDKFPKAYGVYQSAPLVGIVVGLIISSYTAKYGYGALAAISIAGIAISISIMVYAIKETAKSKLVAKEYSVKDIFLEARQTVFNKPSVLYMSLVAVVYAGTVWSFGDVGIVTSMSLGWKKEEIARILSYLTLFNIGVLFFSARYVSKLTVRVAHIMLICAIFIACIGMSFGAWWSIFCISPIWWLAGVNDIAIRTRIQKNAASSSRATTASVISLMTGICYIASALSIGAIATYFKYSIGITTVSFAVLCTLIFLFFRVKKLKIAQDS